MTINSDSNKKRRRAYAVWELTLSCNLACVHCGSRAEHARPNELTTDEALDLVRQLAEVGIDEITLIGGEAYLRRDWLVIAKEITRRGIYCSVTTGGYGLSEELARRMKDAGIAQVSVSVDGMEETHDKQRGRKGSWRACFQAMKNLQTAKIPATCNTQINRLSAPELPLIYESIRNAGARAWQIQLTVPMGNAADNWEILLQPDELLVLFPLLAQIAEHAMRDGVQLAPGNNVGYYGPYERLLQDFESGVWRGCQAGLSTLGIEADGKIKACPSLPTNLYVGGNIREHSLRDIIKNTDELNFNMNAGTEEGTNHLWGFCKTCDYAALCRGGCAWTAHTFFGRRGNNPYCHHRALTQMNRGARERFVLRKRAEGVPFDYGEFELIEEAFETAPQPDDVLRFTEDKIQFPKSWQ